MNYLFFYDINVHVFIDFVIVVFDIVALPSGPICRNLNSGSIK